jgi:hypothetical protein
MQVRNSESTLGQLIYNASAVPMLAELLATQTQPAAVREAAAQLLAALCSTRAEAISQVSVVEAGPPLAPFVPRAFNWAALRGCGYTQRATSERAQQLSTDSGRMISQLQADPCHSPQTPLPKAVSAGCVPRLVEMLALLEGQQPGESTAAAASALVNITMAKEGKVAFKEVRRFWRPFAPVLQLLSRYQARLLALLWRAWPRQLVLPQAFCRAAHRACMHVRCMHSPAPLLSCMPRAGRRCLLPVVSRAFGAAAG